MKTRWTVLACALALGCISDDQTTADDTGNAANSGGTSPNFEYLFAAVGEVDRIEFMHVDKSDLAPVQTISAPASHVMVFSETQRMMYTLEGEGDGRALDYGGDDVLTDLGKQALPAQPTHFALDRSTAWMITGGTTLHSLYVPISQPVDPTPVSTIDGTGHQVVIDDDNNWVFYSQPDLERVAQFTLNTETGELTEMDPPAAELPGENPTAMDVNRHNNLFVATLNGSLHRFDIGLDGSLDHTATVAASDGSGTGNETIGVVAHHNFVYAINRGDDSIAGYAIDDDGSLTLLGFTPVGETPGSGLIISNRLFVAGMDSHALLVFELGLDGRLTLANTEPMGGPVTAMSHASFSNPAHL